MILSLKTLSLAVLYIKHVLLCPVVWNVDSTIHWINLCPVDSALISPLHVFTCIHWIVIYPVDSSIQHILVV